MADPFEALGGFITGGSNLPRQPGTPSAQSSAPQDDCPGMGVHTAGVGATSCHQDHNPVGPYVTGIGERDGFHPQQLKQQQQQQQQNNVIMQGRSPSSHPRTQQPVLLSTDHPRTYPSGQQQLQRQQMMVPGAGWGGGGMLDPSLRTPGNLRVGGWNPSATLQGQQTSALINSGTPRAMQQFSAGLVQSSAGYRGGGTAGIGGERGNGGAAEWTPPTHQLAAYEEMWETASAGCAIPGTVSGRAAVQFFSRSSLPKDTLKTIWSLCDPALTGSIRRQGFFAAMRLIVIAQQGTSPSTPSSLGATPPLQPALPSISSLEATRYAPLPLPRMENLSLLPGSEGGGITVGGSDGAAGTKGMPSVTAAAATVPVAVTTSTMGASFNTSIATLSPALHTDLPANSVSSMKISGGGGDRAAVTDDRSSNGIETLEDNATAGGVRDAATDARARGGGNATLPLSVGTLAGSPRSITTQQQQPQPFGMAEASVAGAGGQTVPDDARGEDDDDFGDFAGAEEETQHQRQQEGMPSFGLPSTKQESDGDGDDFGDFAGAPTSSGIGMTAANSTVGMAGWAATDPTLTNPLKTATAVTVGGDGGATAKGVSGVDGLGMRKTGGLDGVLDITSGLQATGAVERGHQADLQTTPTEERPHDPVMVDRSSIARSKLSVFDAMADLDLAVGQEEWNDFADETTAPPCPATPPTPTPPRASPPASPVATEGVTAAAVAAGDMTVAVGASAAVEGEVAPGCRETSNVGAEADCAVQAPLEAAETLSPSLEPSASFGSSATGAGAGSPLRRAMEGQPQQEPKRQQQQPQQSWPGLGQHGSLNPFPSPEGPQGIAASAVKASRLPSPTIEAESQEDDWGDFEDAAGEGGGNGRAAGVSGKDSLDASGTSDQGDEEWGTFVDVPAAAVEMAVAVPADGTPGGENGTAATEGKQPTASGKTGPPEAEEEMVDPFAEITPATPSQPPPLTYRNGDEERGTAEQEVRSTIGGSVGGSAELAAATAAAVSSPTAGLPLSLRELRDTLAKRGRLEEAIEVQQRMESPTPTSSSSSVHVEPTCGNDDKDGVPGEAGGGEGNANESEDRDLERWRAAVELPPAATLEDLAGTMSAVDASLGERFRARFVSGRPPVEEEAVAAGGGGRALQSAVKRQRAAHRAVYVLSILGAAVTSSRSVTTEMSATSDGQNGVGSGVQQEQEVELEVDLGLDKKGARSPPTMSDWALMTAYVTRMAREGLSALTGRTEGDEVVVIDDNNPSEATAGPPASPEPEASPMGQVEEAAGFVTANAPTTTTTGGTSNGGGVSGEVARSERFQSFARGLHEAVKVCRMIQAAAEDGCCLQGVDGFDAMERAWAELQSSAREAICGGDSVEDQELRSVFGFEDSEVRGGGKPVIVNTEGVAGTAGGGGIGRVGVSSGVSSVANGGTALTGGKDSRCGIDCTSVEAVREACTEYAPAGSALCAVSLQPLEVFGGSGSGGGSGSFGQSSTSGVVDYCGVRYLACAVNLWVNVLDKPPPGPLP